MRLAVAPIPPLLCRLAENEHPPTREPQVCRGCATQLRASFFVPKPGQRSGRVTTCHACRAAASRKLSRRDVAIPARKKCTTCGAEKPSSEFGRMRRSPDGLQAACSACKYARKKSQPHPLFQVTVTKQVCGTCGMEKEAAQFYRNTNLVSGLQTTCRKCANAWSLQYRKARLPVSVFYHYYVLRELAPHSALLNQVSLRFCSRFCDPALL